MSPPIPKTMYKIKMELRRLHAFEDRVKHVTGDTNAFRKAFESKENCLLRAIDRELILRREAKRNAETRC